MNKLEEYQQYFISFEKELKEFIYLIVVHKEETEDIVQETYVKTFKKISSFQEKSSFKT